MKGRFVKLSLVLALLVAALASGVLTPQPAAASHNPCHALTTPSCSYLWNPSTLCCRTTFANCYPKLVCL